MNRREFLIRSAWLGAAGLLVAASPTLAQAAVKSGELRFDSELYKRFRNPELKYHPYFRWWWPDGRVEADEIVREMRMLKGVGIGGVEINTIQFPSLGDPMGYPAKPWLSDEWIDMLKVALDEGKKLGMTCDLLVGTGFPFGGKFLEGDERAQMVGIGVKKLTGPMRYDTSLQNLLLESDPKSSHLYTGRQHKVLSLLLVPDPMSSLDEVKDLSQLLDDGNELSIDIPEGKHALYLLVRIDSFAKVIQGAPGGMGPILNHLNKQAVEKYLNHMSDTIEAKIGPLKGYVRSYFTDSMELAGHNWCNDMPEEFHKRKGYDLMPYLPFILYEIGSFGNVLDYHYGADMTPEFQDTIDRVRFDFDEVKAELFLERFTQTFTAWCNKQGIQSRAQGYGRGFFPLDSSMYLDIPEGESWTTNYLQHRIGEEMGYEDYRRGRSYTMVNKFVTSGAHLAGKRWISCEEMTNTYRVFNATLEFLKLGSDMNAMTGITHSIWHGFNYNAPNFKFPGWIVYGGFYNERNNWWPYFHLLNEYRARLSSILTNAEMFADIAVMPPVYDMWTTMGVQQEPFPSDLNVRYYSFVWEALCKNGNASDYISERVIQASDVKNGWLVYGTRRYRTLILVAVERMYPATLAKLYEFAASGGTVISIEKEPSMSLGLADHVAHDAEVKEWVTKLKALPGRYHVIAKPEDDDFLAWMPSVQEKFDLKPYLTFSDPDLYMMQTRYRTDDGSQIIYLTNCHLHNSHRTRITFSKELTQGRYAWVWEPQTGEKYRLPLTDGHADFDLGPAEALLIVFNKESKGSTWNPLPASAPDAVQIGPWQVELRNSLSGQTINIEMDELKDLKETEYVSFTGTAIYRASFEVSDPAARTVLNLGKVFGVAELKINGEDCGVRWYGRRLYDIAEHLRQGRNEIEVSVTTTMGNYIQKEMLDNEQGQRLTNRPGRPQPVQSLGLAGPVTLYARKG